jgi:Zn-dependent protease
MLLGMAQSPESRAGQILSQYVVTADQVREQIKIIKEKPAPKKPIVAMPKILTRGMRQGISPVFVCLALFTVVTACLLWLGVGNNPRALLIIFIMLGWIVSVALHEFGHAIVAYWGGDESVEDKGYLTLNPLKYSNPILSIVLPVFFLLIGGIGLPGGAVYINIHALRKPYYRSLVSAAGPLANLLFITLLILPFDTLPFSLFFWSAPEEFLMAIAFLGLLQITAIIINLLPIPGLDGFGILEPFLPREIAEFSSFLRPFGFLILYLFVFVDSPISDLFWNTVWGVTELFSFNFAYYANEGLKLFLGW